MPKAKAKKGASRQKLTHDECRMRACLWCAKRKSPGSLQPLSQNNLLLVQKHGGTNLDPASDDQLPKTLCTSCRLGLKALENGGTRNKLPDLFDYGYVLSFCAHNVCYELVPSYN